MVAKVKRSPRRRKSRSRIKNYYGLGLFVLILAASLVVGTLSGRLSFESPQILGVSESQPSLQLGWFIPSPEPSPTPTVRPITPVTNTSSQSSSQNIPYTPVTPPAQQQQQACGIDNGSVANNCSCPFWLVQCVAGQCLSVSPPTVGCDYDAQHGGCAFLARGQTGTFCLAKPVIYLYPTEKTLVDVKVTMQTGQVVVSDPLYDYHFKGWQDVEAYPDGKLVYRGKSYHELFYETAGSSIAPPQAGIVIASSQLNEKLTEITTNLGLLPNEQQEFLTYWLPALRDLNSPYIFFSLISEVDKEKTDHVEIRPLPDTMIEFLAYFKPLYLPEIVTPLKFPTVPKRSGFTAVEWGGTIDSN